MITKAIVEKIIDAYTVKVRIPLLDRVATSASATPTADLNVAAMTTLPGLIPILSTGDVVIVSYDLTEETPIILGCLFCAKYPQSLSNLNVANLVVQETAMLPQTTIIGDITYESLQYIKGASANIQDQLNLLQLKINKLEEYCYDDTAPEIESTPETDITTEDIQSETDTES